MASLKISKCSRWLIAIGGIVTSCILLFVVFVASVLFSMGTYTYRDGEITPWRITYAFGEFDVHLPEGSQSRHLEIFHGLMDDHSVLVADIPTAQTNAFLTSLGFSPIGKEDAPPMVALKPVRTSRFLDESVHTERRANAPEGTVTYPSFLTVNVHPALGPTRKIILEYWYPFN